MIIEGFFLCKLFDFRRYEAELKKENKTEEYRELARGEIRSIDTAIPILKYVKYPNRTFECFFFRFRKEEEHKGHLKEAEDAQQAATAKRKVRLENLRSTMKMISV